MFKPLLTFLVSLYALLFPTPPTIHHDLTTITSLLQSTTLSKRAAHNQKLITVFGIQNAFTTTSPSIHRTFVNHISSLIQKFNNDFARLALVTQAREIGQGYLERGGESGTIGLNDLVQIVVFRTVLTIFFPHVAKGVEEDGRLQDSDKSPWKVFAAAYLPARWSSISQDREVLFSALECMFPWHRTYLPQRNPLNVLIPAHQGLWRVVLRCFLEVRFRNTRQQREKWANTFSEYLNAPEENWHKKDETGLEVQMIIAETLRLYPPTPRMYIQSENGGMEVICIEKMHRSGNKGWGEEAERFRPERWIGGLLDVRDTGAYMPFGRKVEVNADGEGGEGEKVVSQCPSRIRGGPKLIALLVGVLLEVVDKGWELEVGYEKDDVGGEKPLGSGRDMFESLRLRRNVES